MPNQAGLARLRHISWCREQTMMRTDGHIMHSPHGSQVDMANDALMLFADKQRVSSQRYTAAEQGQGQRRPGLL